MSIGTNIFTNKRFGWHPAGIKLPDGFNEDYTPIFDVGVPISHNWDDKNQRLLVVVEHVDTSDLRAKALCAEFYGTVISNLLSKAIDYANLVCDAGRVANYGLAVVNFQSFKHYHLDTKRQTIAEKAMAKRVHKMMAKLQPTHVLVLGDKAAKHVLGHEDIKETRGWVRKYSEDWGKFVGMSTIDPGDLMAVGSIDAALDGEDDDDDGGDRDLYAKTNLLGQVYRDMSHIFTYGKVDDPHGLPFSIHGAEYKHVLLRSMSKVEKLFGMLMEAPVIATDTEATSLNRIANKLLTMQFSMDDYRGFVIPVEHRQSPFSKAERQQIRDMAYELLCNPDVDPFGTERYLVGTNLQFDATQFRQQVQAPVITWPLFDIQSADFLLDENMSELDSFAGNTPKAWSLAAIATRYGSNAYLDKEGFNKADRANMEASNLEDPTVVEYMSLDCVVPFGIHLRQIERAQAEGYKKFKRLLLGQQSNNSHCMSVMEHKGTDIDLKYLKRQMKKDSELHGILQEAKDQLAASDGAREANKLLSEQRGATGSLFDDIAGMDEVAAVEIFNVDKPEHRQVLFQDVMHLEPVSGFGKKARPNGTDTMTLDKYWQSEHREVYEVSLYTRVNKVAKLIGSYIKAFHEKVTTSDDGKADGKLRPSYGFLYVKTGRGNSFKPSLQQTPTRSKEAKYVKRMFAVPFGTIKLKSDYSANEVRFAANIAGDKAMAEPFNVARALRADMFWAANDGDTTRVEALKKELKTKGDVHIQNVYRFFKKVVDKKDPLRDAIKGVVFGVIYGKSAGTLGKDIWSQRVNEVKDAVYGLKKQLQDEVGLAAAAKEAGVKIATFKMELRTKLGGLEADLEALLSDKTKKKGEAQEIMDKMRVEWPHLYKWMARMHESAANDLYVEAPHGRRRNLFGMLIPSNEIQAALCRRAVNAPVQGFGADVGHTSARLIDLHLYKFLRKFDRMEERAPHVPGGVECAVHDALLMAVEYRNVLPTLQIKNWCMTIGVSNYFYDMYGIEWLSPPEIETDIGWNEAEMDTWDYTPEGLRTIILAAVQGQYDAGLFPDGTSVDDVMDEIYSVSTKEQKYLDQNYPWFSQPKYASNESKTKRRKAA